MAEGAGLLNRYTIKIVSRVRIPLSPPDFLKRTFLTSFWVSHSAAQNPSIPKAFQRFGVALDPYLTFSNFSISPLKSPFLASLSLIHANIPVEGTHVLKPSIYLSFRESAFLRHAFFRERKPE